MITLARSPKIAAKLAVLVALSVHASPSLAQATSTDAGQAQKIAGVSQVSGPPGAVQPVTADSAGETLTNGATKSGDQQRLTGSVGAPATPPLPAYVPTEFESYVSDLAGKPLRRFGAELVVPDGRAFVSPPNTAVPADYRVNVGDEIIVDITGSVQAVGLRLIVDKQGQIFVPKVGTITVAGVAYSQLQTLIAGRVSRQYRNFNLNVSLGELRGITVFLTGFVARPGSYTVSSLSTLVNALLAAGGPGPSGSFRSIQVRRGGRIVTDFDSYDFLLKGDDSGDITLQNGDVVYVAPAGAQVAAIGSVNREAIYEARAKDSLTDVLKYAGGANTVADLSRVNVLDPQADDGWRQLTPIIADQSLVRRGLVLRVLSSIGIAQPIHNLQSLVTVSGEVNKPGRYFVKPGTSLDEIVQMAGGLTSDAYVFGSVFVRESLRREQEANYVRAVEQMQTSLLVHANTSAQPLDGAGRLAIVNSLVGQLKRHHIDGRLVLSIAPDANRVPGDFVVQNNDELFIPSHKLDVGVFGLVNSSADFKFVAGRQVKDYIGIAGGYARYADKHHVFVEHANGTLQSGSAALNALVLPGDLIFVPVNPEQGQFWAHLRDLSGILLNGLVAGAAISAVSP